MAGEARVPVGVAIDWGCRDAGLPRRRWTWFRDGFWAQVRLCLSNKGWGGVFPFCAVVFFDGDGLVLGRAALVGDFLGAAV